MPRIGNDRYLTPHWCFEGLQIDWKIFSDALEPAAGDMRIVEFLKKYIADVSWCEITRGADFLNYTKRHDLILTNPPFNNAFDFVRHALGLSTTVIMLLRLDYLGSKKRYSFWNENKPTALHVLSGRPSFIKTKKSSTDMYDYGWFVWDKTNRLKKGIFHILKEGKFDHITHKRKEPKLFNGIL